MSARRLLRLLTASLVLVVGLGPTLAFGAPPTLDPSAPTPTTPYPGGPPEGSSPDGSVVGGEQLDGRGLVLPADAPSLPTGLTAHGWVLGDLDSGAVLAARDPHGRYYPASTLKTLTLLALYDALDPATVVTATFEDADVEGTRVGLVEGGRYPVPLLFQALVMASGNDAAAALARAAGGVDVALERMNDTASQLQAYDTLAGTPSGLDVAGQSSSAYDLALIMAQLVDDPELLAVMQTPTAQMPAVPPRFPAYQIQNQNQMLTTYPGALAGKNGFTDAARYTFVAAAAQGGRRLVVSMMQGEQAPTRMIEQAESLLDWGFALPADVDPVGELVDPRPPGVPPPTSAPATTAATAAPASSRYSAAPAAADGESSSDSDRAGPAALVVVGGAAASAAVLMLLLRGRRRRH